MKFKNIIFFTFITVLKSKSILPKMSMEMSNTCGTIFEMLRVKTRQIYRRTAMMKDTSCLLSAWTDDVNKIGLGYVKTWGWFFKALNTNDKDNNFERIACDLRSVATSGPLIAFILNLQKARNMRYASLAMVSWGFSKCDPTSRSRSCESLVFSSLYQ